jgi:hypothetical protein
MRNSIAVPAALAAAAMIAMAGCAAQAGSEPASEQPSRTASAEPSATPTPTPKPKVTPARFAPCKELDAGALTYVTAASEEAIKKVVRLGIQTDCPEHLAAFDAAVAPPPPPSKDQYGQLGERDWKLLVKSPDASVGQRVLIYAQVTQFDAATGTTAFRAQAAGQPTDYYFSDGDNAIVTGTEGLLAGVVEDDILKIWATVAGSYSYDTQIGGNTTVPKFTADYIDIIGRDS